jgi:hypothetical protein
VLKSKKIKKYLLNLAKPNLLNLKKAIGELSPLENLA